MTTTFLHKGGPQASLFISALAASNQNKDIGGLFLFNIYATFGSPRHSKSHSWRVKIIPGRGMKLQLLIGRVGFVTSLKGMIILNQ